MEVAAGAPVARLYELVRRARLAATPRELAFLLVNDSLALLNFRQAALWSAEAGIDCLSGVVQAEANAPYVQWLTRLSDYVVTRMPAGGAMSAGDLPAELASEWDTWWPAYALVLPLGKEGEPPQGLWLLAGEAPWPEQDVALAREWSHAWWHAFLALRKQRLMTLTDWRRRLLPGKQDGDVERARWWRRPGPRWIAALLMLAALPVRLTVLAPGELVPAHPAVVRAPLDGVISSFQVQPNQRVSQGQALFGFDELAIQGRLDVARQTLATIETEYRQASQQALADMRVKSQLALLTGRIDEKRAEVEYLQEQLARARVLAPQAGIVLLDDPSEWIGRPVTIGERILRIAAPDDVEIEAWLPLGDAVDLATDAEVKLYLNATPLAPVTARLRYFAHDAVQRPDGSYAYRIRATLDAGTTHRVGLKGAAKLHAGWVPLAYWALRRPMATVRVTLGL
ncbi:efflux RND transporter periplasmic adaptor subunit [Roseateles sp. BYS96W]|uniref:Efflux RND transporter periplasmic adaptor subunit n=1 Tax=Pelomonas nitida TaxID=3299027 RepID=A0ABW7G1P5_9BURK